MSIVNAFISADCGIICVDTKAGPDGGPYIEVSKLIPLPHINAVVAYRGTPLFVMPALMAAFSSGGDFDELSRQMPAVLTISADKAVDIVSNSVGTAPITREEAGCGEVIIVGYSPERSRIVGHHFRRETLDHGFVTTNYVSRFSAPAWDDVDLNLQSIHAHPTKEGLKALALSQLHLTREREKAGVATGGRLIYAEVRRDGLTVENIMDFPPEQR